MTVEKIMEIFKRRCEEIGTVKRMNNVVLLQLANTLSKKDSLTEEDIVKACKNPTAMLNLLK